MEGSDNCRIQYSGFIAMPLKTFFSQDFSDNSSDSSDPFRVAAEAAELAELAEFTPRQLGRRNVNKSQHINLPFLQL